MLTDIDKKWTHGECLNFCDEGPVSDGAITHKFSVISRLTGSTLGYVKWFIHWRQYCFFPLNAVFDKKFLREVAEFCERKTEEHRAKK